MFLVNDDHPVEVAIIDDLFGHNLGVRGLLKHNSGDSLLILVNEDDHRHWHVDVTGLTPPKRTHPCISYTATNKPWSAGRYRHKNAAHGKTLLHSPVSKPSKQGAQLHRHEMI